MKYEFMPHTADIRIKAFGKTLEDTFSNSAIGFTKFLTKSKIKKNVKKEISCEGLDLENLLYNFIEEFIVLFDSEYFLLGEIKDIRIKKETSRFKLKATVIGDINNNYKINSSIKAITYNDMQIEKKGNQYEIIFTLDI